MRNLKKFFSKKNIVIITCYDATFASYLSKTNCDALLVGDSLGILIKGELSTHNVSINEIIYHTKAVRLGAPNMPIISDMPINTYNNKENALENAKLLLDAGADIVKIEGENNILEIVHYLSTNNIKVCGHIGSMPQINKKSSNDKLLKNSKDLEKAGLKMLVLSMTSPSDDKVITNQLRIPTIGFRSSSFCNGEVEVLYDLLGITKFSFTNKKNSDKNISLNTFSILEKFIEKIHSRT